MAPDKETLIVDKEKQGFVSGKLSLKGFSFWRLVYWLSFTIFAVNTLAFVVLGEVNADEGWYLYASKLVTMGQQPYRDFAYTQTPLLLYLYGVFLSVFTPSIYLGRALTSLISISTFFLSTKFAEIKSGAMAAGITGLLWATFTHGIYFQSTTRTYAITTLLFLLALIVFSSKLHLDLKVILACLFVILASLIRLSALFFAIPFFLYVLFSASKGTKLIVAALVMLAAAWMIILILPNPESAMWSLVGHHTSQWGDTPENVFSLGLVLGRLNFLITEFIQYILLFSAALIISWGEIIEFLRKNVFSRLTVIGLSLFTLSHFASGGFRSHYFIPVIFVLFSFAGILIAVAFSKKVFFQRNILQALFVSALLLGLIRGGYAYFDFSGESLPVEEIKIVSAFVEANSSPKDKIFALEALWVALEADRQTFQNMTMSQFSYIDDSKELATRLHLVSDQIISELIIDATPKIVILTELDWEILQNNPAIENMIESLEENYNLGLEVESFGQNRNTIQVYTLK
jgi:hypothetical protein